ncbi:MAG: sialidase family protein [Armatimonadia bacterium]
MSGRIGDFPAGHAETCRSQRGTCRYVTVGGGKRRRCLESLATTCMGDDVMLQRHDFAAMSPGTLPEGFSASGWALKPVARHPLNTERMKAVDSPDCHVAFPSICKTLSGELLVVYREAFTHAVSQDPHDGKIALIRSTDGGRSWSERVIIMDADDYDDRNAAIACAPDGQLLVCWDKWLPPLHRGAYFMTSEDDGYTWSDPRKLQPVENVHTRSPALKLRDGNWLIPLAEGEGDGLAAYATIVNPNTGESEMFPITTLGDKALADEVCVTYASDGAIVALGRSYSHRYLWQTRSVDEGRTWERPWMSEIPSQYSPADLITLDDGRLLCSFSFRERRNERLVLSNDGGATWDIENSVDVFDGTMEVGGDRSYAATVQADAETVGTVLYETKAYPDGGTIYFVRTPLAEFERTPVTALYAQEAEEAKMQVPVPEGARKIGLRYRFMGKFGEPPSRLEVGLAGVTVAYQMGATPDRKGNINWVDAQDAEGRTLASQEAAGDWFDDGNEHELRLVLAEEKVALEIDGWRQFEVPAAAKAESLEITARRASVAIYEVGFA